MYTYNSSSFEKFLDNPPTYEYKTTNIGDVFKKTNNDITMSTFSNVIDSLSTINQDWANDWRVSRKNINNIVNWLVDINDTGKAQWSNISKTLSNKIVYIYDNLVTKINDQRSENLKLQLELAKATKDKNDLRFEVDQWTEEVRKLEVSLGVEKDAGFERMMLWKKIYNRKGCD